MVTEEVLISQVICRDLSLELHVTEVVLVVTGEVLEIF